MGCNLSWHEHTVALQHRKSRSNKYCQYLLSVNVSDPSFIPINNEIIKRTFTVEIFDIEERNYPFSYSEGV